MSDQIPEEVAAIPQDQPVESAPAEVVETPPEEPTPEQVEAKKSRGVQKRLDELTRTIGEGQRREDRLMALLERTATGGTLPNAPSTPAGPPSRDNYATLEEYQEAKSYFQVDQRLAEVAQKAEQARQEQVAAQKEADWHSRSEKASEKYEDYTDAVTELGWKIAPKGVIATAIKASEEGPEMAYFLAKNPAELARLEKMDGINQAIALGKIASSLAGSAPSKPVSRASAPIDPVKGVKSGTKSLDEASMDDYYAARKQQGAGFR